MVKYKASQVTILVHAGKPTNLVSNPSEIGTTSSPADDGTIIPIEATLTETTTGSVIAGKTLHLYDPAGAELKSGVTDISGKVVLDYTVNADHDGLNLSIKYLGD